MFLEQHFYAWYIVSISADKFISSFSWWPVGSSVVSYLTAWWTFCCIRCSKSKSPKISSIIPIANSSCLLFSEWSIRSKQFTLLAAGFRPPPATVIHALIGDVVFLTDCVSHCVRQSGCGSFGFSQSESSCYLSDTAASNDGDLGWLEAHDGYEFYSESTSC